MSVHFRNCWMDLGSSLLAERYGIRLRNESAGAKKHRIVSCEKTKKCHFGRRKNDVFSRETIRCFLAPALSLRRRIPYLSANRLEPRISRDQHIQTCQFKTTNVKIHPAVPKVYTHLISFGQMEMANASGNFGNALVGLRAWNDAIHDFRRSVRKNYIFSDRKKNNVFSGICKNAVFSGHGSRMTVRKNPGYLAGWLAIWLAI